MFRPGAFVFLADRWNTGDLRDSRHVRLPLGMDGDRVTVRWREAWGLSAFDG